MKKKVALLLAVVMVLSMLPVNVFGNQVMVPGAQVMVTGMITNTVTTPFEAAPGEEGGREGGHTYLAPISVHFPISALQGTSVFNPATGMYEARLMVELANAVVNHADVRANLGEVWGDMPDWRTRPNNPFGQVNAGRARDDAGVVANPQTAAPGTVGWVMQGDWAQGMGRVFIPTTTGAALATQSPVPNDAAATHLASISATWTNGWNASVINVTIPTEAPVTAGTEGFMSFTLPVRGFLQDNNWLDAAITVRTAPEGIEGAGASIIIANNWRIAGQGLNSVSWSASPRGFTSALLVPNLRLSENRFGVIEGSGNVIRLVAPSFYTWSFGGFATTGRPGVDDPGYVVGGRPGHQGLVNDGLLTVVRGGAGAGQSFQPVNILGVETMRTIPTGFGVGHAAGQHVLYIHLDNIQRNSLWSPGLGWLEIANLWLIPDGNAPATGAVNIRAEFGTFAYAPGTWPATPNNHPAIGGAPWRNWTNFGRVLSSAAGAILSGGQVAESLHVGNRGVAGLAVDVHGGPNEIRTGHLGAWRTQNATTGYGPQGSNWLWNRDNEGLQHWTGVATSTLIIEENIPGAFTVGFGSPINFEFLDDDGNAHPGIRILGMEARAGTNRDHQWNRGELNNFHRSLRGVPGSGTMPGAGEWGGANQNWMTFSGWVSALDQRLPNAAGVGRLTDTMATVYLPSQTIYDVPGGAILEVRFWLSVEAGFEWKYGPEIDVTISGQGVANLDADNRVHTVALAQDPVVVTHADDAVQLEVGTLYNVIGRQAISDVTIDVVNNAAFNIGQEIWLYIGTDTPGRNFDLNISQIPTVTVNPESGLRLDSGRLANPAFTRMGRDAIVFTVTRQPYGGNAPAPVITISNLSVDGQAWPGIEYHLVVSGTGIANNDQEVFHRLTETGFAPIGMGFTDADAARMRLMNRGVFTTMPFYATTLVNAAGGIADIIDGPGGFGGGIAGGGLRFWEGMSPIATNIAGYQSTVADPFRFWISPAGPRVAMLNPRVFAYKVGGTIDYASGVVTLVAPDVNGEMVTVVLTVGSTQASVNGQSVDIATVAGQSGPAGSVSTQNIANRTFIPLRFIANVFGYVVDATGFPVIEMR